MTDKIQLRSCLGMGSWAGFRPFFPCLGYALVFLQKAVPFSLERVHDGQPPPEKRENPNWEMVSFFWFPCFRFFSFTIATSVREFGFLWLWLPVLSPESLLYDHVVPPALLVLVSTLRSLSLSLSLSSTLIPSTPLLCTFVLFFHECKLDSTVVRDDLFWGPVKKKG